VERKNEDQAQRQKRAIGIVRVSQRGGREDEHFKSPDEQRERMEAACQLHGYTLLRCTEEIDVKGDAPLEKRQGLREAVEAVERGEADMIVAGYFDRLFRGVRIKEEVGRRVDNILTLDFGAVSDASAAQWMNGTMMAVVSEYQKRSTEERTRAAQVKAIGEGKQIGAVTFGYVRGSDGRLKSDPDRASIVREAFRRAALDLSVAAEYLRQASPDRKWTTTRVRRMVASRTYLGEVTFGELCQKDAHEPIVSRREWEAAQPAPTRKKRRSREFPLSGIASCAHCGGPLVGSNTNGERTYGCRNSGCPSPPTILANRLERYCLTVLRHYWKTPYAAPTEDLSSALAAAERKREDSEDELATFAADATARRILGDGYHPALQARKDQIEVDQAECQALAKQATPLRQIDPQLVTAGEHTSDQLRRLLDAGFETIAVRRRKGRRPVAERVNLTEHGASEPLPPLVEDLQADPLQAAA